MRQYAPGQMTRTQQAMDEGPSGPAPGQVSRVEQLQRSLMASPAYHLDRTSSPIPADAGVKVDDAAPEAGHAEPERVTEAPGGQAELRALGVEPRVEPSDAIMASQARKPDADNPHQMADQDDFNKARVQSNDKHGDRQLYRPGVRFNTHVGQVDILYPKRSAHRYVIDHLGQFVAKDMIHPGTPVAFNLAPLRKHGKLTYALTFVGGAGSLWTSLSVFRDDDHLKEQIHAQSKGVLPSDQVGARPAERWVFRSASDADPALARLADRYVLPDKSGDENKLDHYRYRGKTGLYNVLLNLPQAAERTTREAPPVAVDSALPEWSFFVASGDRFRRQVPVFDANDGAPAAFVTFVFGFLGKATRQGEQRDDHRRGWVPQGVLRRA